MRIRSLLAVAGAALAGVLGVTSGATAAPAGPQPIIGGGTVSSAPWAAAVFSNGSFTCSGSVIASTWVLTARHCVSGTMSVRIGSVYYASGGTTRTVSASYTRYDLALLRLSSAVSTSTVSLASSNPPISSTNTIYGWGMTCYSGCGASSQLKTASVRVTSTSVTDAYGGQAIRSTEISGNAWRGDSGGPQFYNGQQVGVASTADGVSIQNYGSVAYNRAWITSVAGV
ncbi:MULTISPECIES: S1 family peptidase [unclassified Micromonospora]|uniref:S1 family peptidase n=1 Tax=unclassified Micromonospora TaxID=2617518 RepID=UPI0036280BAF